uniref:ARAD1D23474p n=1 Tax=Blastobotrys adeninivorans TaxID=409370 RepID=A0A060TGG5_BLAAD
MSTIEFDPEQPLRLAQKRETVSEEDSLLQQDIEGSRPKPKRNAIKFGYDDDSEDDAQDWKQRERAREESDDDMFADSDKEEDKEEPGKKQRFLDIDEFEKQAELDSSKPYNGDDGEGDEDEDEEDVREDNVDVEYFVNPGGEEEHEKKNGRDLKKSSRREPKLEAFNLRSDLEEGQFDEQGNFIRNAADSEAHHDQWLENVSKKDISAARRAHERQQAKNAADQKRLKRLSKHQALSNLIESLNVGESSLEALQRLSPPKRNRGRNKKDSQKSDETEASRKQTVEVITDSVESLQMLMSMGSNDVYDLTREELQREYQRETGEAYVSLKRKRSDSERENDLNPGEEQEWVFQWEGSDEVHGPYDRATMVAWDEDGYFDDRMKAKPVGQDEYLTYTTGMFN